MPVEAELECTTPTGPSGALPGSAPTAAAAAAAAAAASAAEGQEELDWACEALQGLAGRACSVAGRSCRTQQRCLLPFVRRATQSVALHSALLSLELSGSHPPSDSTGLLQDWGLESTLAQLLALHCRAGVVQATGASMLAALWLLQSLDSCQWSDASACLSAWCRHLAAFSPELVQQLTVNWGASFACLRSNLVAAQAHMLDLLGWRVRLDFETEVAPCMELLFRASPEQPPSPSPPPLLAASEVPCSAEPGDHLLRPCTPVCEEPPRRLAAPALTPAGPPPGPPAEAPPATGPCPASCAVQPAVAAAMHAMCTTIRWQAALIRQLQASAPSPPSGGIPSSQTGAVVRQQGHHDRHLHVERAQAPTKRRRVGL